MNCETRLIRSQCQLLLRKYSKDLVDFVFFTCEQVFKLAPPVNWKNERVYAPVGTKKCEISAHRLSTSYTTKTFSKCVMVSVAVFKFGCTSLVFVEPAVKVMCCCPISCYLPSVTLLATCMSSNRTAHQARDTVNLLLSETPAFIAPDLWPPNSPDSNPVDDKIWGIMQECVYRSDANT